VSRFPTASGNAGGVERAGRAHELDQIEELGDEAIIAQQTEAHLPQKRAQVQDESRSVVISDAPVSSSRRPPPYRAERAEATLVMRDRRDLDAMRRRLMERRNAGGIAPYVWVGLAIAAFAAGGLVTLLLVRGGAPSQLTQSAEASLPPVSEHQRSVANPTVRKEPSEPVTPQVTLEELPLEKPKRR